MRASYQAMHLRMDHGGRLSLQRMGEFSKAGEGVRLAGQSRAEVYARIQQTLVCQE